MTEGRYVDKERLVMLTDAIIAIVMTILVLDLKVQAPEGATDGDVLRQLHAQLPHFIGFVISFAVMAFLWFPHHDLLRAIARPTYGFAVLNFFFLGSIATLPFSTAFAAEYSTHSVPVATLALNMMVMNAFLSGLFRYAVGRQMADFGPLPTRVQRYKRALGIAGTFVFMAAAGIAFYSPAISLVLLALVPVLHLIPVPERQPRRQPEPEAIKLEDV